jgi:hypothetical protein
MKRRTWIVFCAVQLVGCIFASYGTVYSESAFVGSSWLAGFPLLLPGNLPATMLAQKFVHVRTALVFFPVAIGFNAILWIAFSSLWRTLRGRKPLTPPRRYGIALIGTVILFAIANVINFLRPVSCYDCFFPYGVPFTLYREGGFAGGGGPVWAGLAADSGVVILIAALVGSAWQWFASRRAI